MLCNSKLFHFCLIILKLIRLCFVKGLLRKQCRIAPFTKHKLISNFCKSRKEMTTLITACYYLKSSIHTILLKCFGL